MYFLCSHVGEKNSLGILKETMANVETGEQLLDVLQSHGMISHFHTSYIPWLLKGADVNKKLMEDWKSIEATRPQDLSLFHMPDIPETGIWVLTGALIPNL